MTVLTVPDDGEFAHHYELTVEPAEDDGLVLRMDGDKVGHISSVMLHAAASHDRLVIPERQVE